MQETLRIVTVVGARPQFIKAAPLSRALNSRGHHEVLVHTGQHYDPTLSGDLFRELRLRRPDHDLGVGSGSHAEQTGRMLIGLEPLLLEESPDWVVVFGDTNSTLAGALAASKLGLRVAHVEAGLRSYNRSMPEELNRIVADQLSDLLLCPSPAAVSNLEKEGVDRHVVNVGDIMLDALRSFEPLMPDRHALAEDFGVGGNRFGVITLHRAATTDDRERLASALRCIEVVEIPMVFPLHPRTEKAIDRFGLSLPLNVVPSRPVTYLKMLALIKHGDVVLTDSGGIQKEAMWLDTPCVTLRSDTEWVETVEIGMNTLTDVDPERVRRAVAAPAERSGPWDVYGDGTAAEKIVSLLESLSE